MGKLSTLLENSPHGGMVADGAAMSASLGGRIEVKGNEEERDRLVLVKSLFEQIDQQGGVDPATFLNMHPWTIRGTGPHNDGIEIPACPIGQPYQQFVQRDIRVDWGDIGGKYVPTAIWPIIIMRDIMRQHEAQGGMVVYMGELRMGENRRGFNAEAAMETLLAKAQDEETRQLLELLRKQQTPNDTRYATDTEVKRLVKVAEERQISHYRSRCAQVSQAYASDAKVAFRSIMPNDRMMARWLHNRGIYATLPIWITEERPDNYKPKTCLKCGTDVDPKGFACPKCGYIHDGIKAYVAGEILDDHVALKRHSREELDNAGLKHVKTLAEERETPKGKKKE